MAWMPGDYFDGGMEGTAHWLFSWAGEPHASTSLATRTVWVELVGAVLPRLVQITVPAIPVGVAYVVEGVAGEYVWRVRGGTGVGDGATLILADNRAPLNMPVRYRVTMGATVWLSEEITVVHADKYVLQSLDGRMSVSAQWMDNGLPWEADSRSVAFAVAGRARPVVRVEVAGAGGGTLRFNTTGAQTLVLAGLLSPGRPIVVRTDGDVRDFAPVEIVQPTSVTSVLTGAHIQEGDTRAWTVGYLLIDDPEPNTPIVRSTWDDFDDVYAGLTWADFDAQWAGLTWDDFDRFDWAGQA